MKALVMRGPGQFGVEEVPKPVCGDREVLVQVQAVAICGSDPVLLAGGSLSDGLPGSLPHIAGHEGAGIIVEEAMAIQPGDPYGDNYMRIALETLEYMVQHAPKDIKVNPPICMAPFTVCAQLCGIGDFCANTLEDPDMVQAMLDVATETCIRYMKACEKVMGGPLHHLLLSDDLSSFLSVRGFEEWVLPTYEKIFKEFPNNQKWLHNDAKANHLAKAIADAGFQAWQYAPSVPSEHAMAETGGRVSLLGGLHPVELQSMSAQQTYDVCMEKPRSFGGNNKFVLGVGGSVNQIPVENLMAMFHAADDYKL